MTEAGLRRTGPGRDAPAPWQLPPDVAHFTGRAELAARLAEVLGRSSAAAIVGMAGVGKTSLAVHVGHRTAERFPDGQLYVDLRGAREPLPVLHALGLLLRALGVAPDTVPADAGEAAAVLRSRLAHRRVLLVLDDAASGEQVVPLLPGSGASAALITSRHELAGLPQAHHLRLDVLDEPDAVALLASVAGRARTAAEPGAAAAVVRRCGRLPLAVDLVGARLAARPAWPLSHMAELLSAENHRLDVLRHGDDAGVRASFAVSVDHLDGAAATAFTLTGLIDSRAVTTPVVASLLDVGEPAAGRILERLADRHLLRPMSPGRYRVHELLRDFAASGPRRRCPTTTAPPRSSGCSSCSPGWCGPVTGSPLPVRSAGPGRDRPRSTTGTASPAPPRPSPGWTSTGLSCAWPPRRGCPRNW